MSGKILPFELAHPSVAGLQARARRGSNALFWTLSGGLIAGLAALPIVRMEVGIHARGQIVAIQNNIPLNASQQGQVIWHQLQEDRFVQKGETLLVLNGQMLQEQKKKLEMRIREQEALEMDLEQLVGKTKGNHPLLSSRIYRQEFNQYQHELGSLRAKQQYALQVQERTQKLYEQQVISKAEFEKIHLETNLAIRETGLFEEKQQKSWAIELTQVQKELADLRNEFRMLQIQEKDLQLRAPADGIIIEPAGLEPGSYVFPGQPIAQISSHQSLMAEVYIPSAQIGYIREHMPVKIHLDAYAFNEWGAVEGRVQQVSKEVKLVENIPVFSAKISFQDSVLYLKNGYAGPIKKGMTLSARFIVAKRSLLQLTYEKAEDWLDPRSGSAIRARSVLN